MNFTSSDWNTRLRQSIDRLHSPSLSNNFTHDILLIIGLMTVGLLLLLLIFQFALKIRQIYRTSEPHPFYEKLFNSDTKHCRCLPSSCLPKFQCIKPICQISNPSSHYEQISERHSSISRVYPSACVPVHLVK